MINKIKLFEGKVRKTYRRWESMKIEQLEYVLEVAKSGAISKASENLHVTQSAVSQSITALEKELGVVLFHRARTGTLPTIQGKKVIQKAVEILLKVEELREEIKEDSKDVQGKLTFASIPIYMPYLLEPLAAFKADYPNVEIEIMEQETHEIINDITRFELDIGLITLHDGLKDKMENLDFQLLNKGEMKVFAHKDSAISVNDSIEPQALINETIVMYDGDYVKWFVQNFIAEFGSLQILFTSNNTDVIKKAVIQNMAITFSPELYKEGDTLLVNQNAIKKMNILNHQPVHIAFGFVYPKKKTPSLLARKFMKYIESAMSPN